MDGPPVLLADWWKVMMERPGSMGRALGGGESETKQLQKCVSGLHTQISELVDDRSGEKAKISELTEGRAKVEKELQQREESEAALRSQIAQLQEEISQCEAKISELTEGRAIVEKEILQREEPEAALRSQIAQLQEEISQCEAKISELTDGRAKVEEELQQREESEAALRSQIAQLQEEISQREAKISELTEGRAIVEKELLQQEESEAALRSQIAQEISQMKSSLTASEESRSLAESALAQLQQQHDLLKKSCSERLKAKLELRDLVNELSEVTDWFHFGLQLNVPFSQLMVIKRNTAQHDVLGKIYMLQEWLNIVWPEASWADIVAALVRIRMRGLTQRLAEKYGVPMLLVDDATLETRQGASNNEETQSTNTQLLAEIQRLHGKFDEQDKKMTAINTSLEIERSERQTALENTLKSLRSVEDGQRELKSLKDLEMVIKEQLESKKRELHYLQQLLQFRTRENEELNTLIKSKQGEIEQLQSNLLKTEGKLESAQEEVKLLRDQLWQARRELEARHSRVQKLERERTELQAEMNRERREVEHTLTQKAAALPTQEPAHEMEYQHDQAMELLSESSGHEVTSRQEDSQREEQMRDLLVRVRKLESLRLTWRTCQDAPQPLARGSAADDTKRHTVYFSHYRSVYAYKWQREEWSKLCDCPNYTHSLAVMGGLLTAVGGVQSMNCTNTVLSLVGDGSERRWEKHFPAMPTKREWTAVICSGKHLVVMGGIDRDILTTVEVLNTETRQWLTASSLPFPLSEASATIVGDNIYLVGGYDRGGWLSGSVLTCSLTALLQSCHPHLPTSQSPPVWHQVADTPAYMSTFVTLNGELVAVGGCDSSYNPTDSVYAYDPATNSWNVISHMNKARRKCLAVVLPGDRLMVVGGLISNSHTTPTVSVEIATLITV